MNYNNYNNKINNNNKMMFEEDMMETLWGDTPVDPTTMNPANELFGDSSAVLFDNELEDNHRETEDILGKIVLDLEIPSDNPKPEAEVEEELQTAGIGVTEDPFFAETSKAANLFQEKKKSDDTQDLIDEMEEFLNQHEQEQHQEEPIGEEEAQKLLTALMEGNMEQDDSGIADLDLTQNTLNSVTHLVNDKGEKIIIVIANDDNDQNVPSPQTLSETAESPKATSDEDMDSDDSEWSPVEEERRTSKRSNAGRHSKYEMGLTKVEKKATRGRKSVTPFAGVKDKKERKKLQNVVAARRYRDKKKNEQFEAEMVEEKLLDKNQRLKSRLAEMEGEVKTLKKLVMELGLMKTAKFRGGRSLVY